MSTRSSRPLLAVLVDADNVPAKYADAILREIRNIGEPALQRVYGDWSKQCLGPWLDKTRLQGMVARQQTANISGKNASDIGLVIDAMDMLHSGRFDGFVLVSSDSDFTQLASRLREDGRTVIGIGEERAPAALRNVCNRFILIENIITESLTRVAPAHAAPIIYAAMRTLEQTDEWCKLAQVGISIRAVHPDFDARSYGATKLIDLVRKIGTIEMRMRNDHPEIRWIDQRRKRHLSAT